MNRTPAGHSCPSDHGHAANFTCYNKHKCRCAECRAHANRAAARRRRLKNCGRWVAHQLPSLGTRRRLQALMVLGWSQSKLAAELGLRYQTIGVLVTGRYEKVYRTTHEAVAALFDRLWNTTPEHDRGHALQAYNRTRNYAAAYRWLPPLAWDDIDNDTTPPLGDGAGDIIDEVAVDLACAGLPVRLTAREHELAVTILNARGMTDPQIADRLGIADRTVLRIRHRMGVTPSTATDHQVIPITQRQAA